MLLLTLLLVVTVRALMDCKCSDNLWNIIAMRLSARLITHGLSFSLVSHEEILLGRWS